MSLNRKLPGESDNSLHAKQVVGDVSVPDAGDELGLTGCLGADSALSLSLINFGSVGSGASKTTAKDHTRHTFEIA